MHFFSDTLIASIRVPGENRVPRPTTTKCRTRFDPCCKRAGPPGGPEALNLATAVGHPGEGVRASIESLLAASSLTGFNATHGGSRDRMTGTDT